MRRRAFGGNRHAPGMPDACLCVCAACMGSLACSAKECPPMPSSVCLKRHCLLILTWLGARHRHPFGWLPSLIDCPLECIHHAPLPAAALPTAETAHPPPPAWSALAHTQWIQPLSCAWDVPRAAAAAAMEWTHANGVTGKARAPAPAAQHLRSRWRVQLCGQHTAQSN